MYLVSGCNMFGQWLSRDFILFGFQNVSMSENVFKNFEFHPKSVQLVEINWSYNVFRVDDSFYITGSWRGEIDQFLKLELPAECQQCIKGDKIKDFTIVGNDYHIILINQDTYNIWIINLENKMVVKKLKLNIDAPIKTVGRKRVRGHDMIIKAVATNNSVIYLTESGVVYTGLVPTYLHTLFSQASGKICDIASGYEHFIMLTEAGRVYTWGNGRRLQLGHGDLSNLESPTEVEALAGIKMVKISAGGWHSMALSEFGDLYAWGWNDSGQLGIKTQPDDPNGVLKTEGLKSFPNPTLVELYDDNDEEVKLNIKDIACGSRHSAILLEDNSIWTSGNNKYGQLGFNPEEYSVVNYFKKAFEYSQEFKLKCGLWSTVLIKDE